MRNLYLCSFLLVYVSCSSETNEQNDLERKVEEIFSKTKGTFSKQFLREQQKALSLLKDLQAESDKTKQTNKIFSEDYLTELRKLMGPPSDHTQLNIIGNSKGPKDLFYEGDIVLSPKQINNLIKSYDTRKKRSTTTDLLSLWNPDIPIPYLIYGDLYEDKSLIEIAHKVISDNTCISFVENATSREDKLFYFKGSDCHSWVGRQNIGDQEISIGDSCADTSTIVHETMHALGFFHTHTRYDRDDYITVYTDNIQKYIKKDFEKHTEEEENHFNMTYEYGSVMQYFAYAGSINATLPSMVPKNVLYFSTMGRQEDVPIFDLKQINLLYNCSAKCSNTTVKCENGGFINPNTCNSCVCPKFYGGTLCTEDSVSNAPVCNGNTQKISNEEFAPMKETTGRLPSDLPRKYDYYDYVNCNTIVECPAGKKVEMKITKLVAQCNDLCLQGGYEINLGNVDLYGMFFCCPGIYNRTFTTLSNKLYLHGVSKNSTVEMEYDARCI